MLYIYALKVLFRSCRLVIDHLFLLMMMEFDSVRKYKFFPRIDFYFHAVSWPGLINQRLNLHRKVKKSKVKNILSK